MSDRFDSRFKWSKCRRAAIVVLGLLFAGAAFPSSAASVTLAWNANSETNLSGYRLYYGQASRSYVGAVEVSAPTTTGTVANLQAGQTYFFAVTAYLSTGMESGYSDEVFYTVPGGGGGTSNVLSTLTIVIHGDGAVTPNLNGQSLIVGNGYQLTALPGSGQAFSSWGGDVAGSTEVLTFVMQSNMVIEATFVANPFLLAAGTYSGLVAETDQVRHERSGSFTLTSTKRGTYSAKLQLGRTKISVKGLLGVDGKATNVVLRPGQNPLTVEVGLEGSGRMTGRVTDGTWTAQLLGDRQFYNSKTNPAPFAGSYTIVVPPDAGGGAGPQGDGYGTVRVDGNGAATFIGMLADGTKATQRVPVSEDGSWPFYLWLYKGGGSALGWLTVTNNDVSGLVSWIKPAMACKFYTGGLTNESTVAGSGYVPPTSSEQHGGGVRSTDLTFTGANLSQLVTAQITLLPNGKMAVQNDGSVKFGVSPTTGLFKGTVLDPLSGKPRVFSGVMLQKWNAGAGMILGTNQVGLIDIRLD